MSLNCFNNCVTRRVSTLYNHQSKLKQTRQTNELCLIGCAILLVVGPAIMAEWLSAWLRHGNVHGYVESHLYGSDIHSSSRVSSESLIQLPQIQIIHEPHDFHHWTLSPFINLPFTLKKNRSTVEYSGRFYRMESIGSASIRPLVVAFLFVVHVAHAFSSWFHLSCWSCPCVSALMARYILYSMAHLFVCLLFPLISDWLACYFADSALSLSLSLSLSSSLSLLLSSLSRLWL